MISTEETIKLKQIIGSTYTDDVLTLLNAKGIRNRNGHPHTAEYVRVVFIGLRSNQDIEAAIWELAQLKQAEAEEVIKQKNNILNINDRTT